jgi:hypothetical protein
LVFVDLAGAFADCLVLETTAFAADEKAESTPRSTRSK